MKCTSYDMNAYKLHIIKTDKFKTITVGVAFRRKIIKEEITIRNLLKELMINATESYPDERKLIIATEELYDLKLLASNYRIGNDTILSFTALLLINIYLNLLILKNQKNSMGNWEKIMIVYKKN